ncbi:TetR/AcrR family transcriptional regulator [Nocardia beijingensis]|uniref:TetR/AcrR family transcriptional regulator n=1 Tax=Nocardia beijingensis TaxID=95162 RepID=A0ABW7WR22_9NOCA|nr:TetR/AcrR family transcriptional regulator [Nocardia beijingensis]MBF6076193.1 TetR/AcrR family transcriptional regulator [Nocardia beijingensis]
MSASTEFAQVGRRLRKVHDKQSRIFEAASALFAERGFEGVTTQQISDRAEIAAGTLFRYAATKGELLLMVYNEDFRAALAEGGESARAEADTAAAVIAMLRPLLAAGERHPGNTVVYQRELLFGSPADRYRREGLALVDRLETMMAERMAADARARGLESEKLDEQARWAGRSLFAAVHLLLARPATGAHPGHDARADLRAQVAQIVAGFFATVERSKE